MKLALRSGVADGAGAIHGGSSIASGGCDDDWLPLLVLFCLALLAAGLLCCCCLLPLCWWPREKHLLVVDLILAQGQTLQAPYPHPHPDRDLEMRLNPHPHPQDFHDLPTGDDRKDWERQLIGDIAGVLMVEPERVKVANVTPGPSVHVESESLHNAPSGYRGKTSAVVTVHITCATQKKNNKWASSSEGEEQHEHKEQHKGGPAHLLAHLMLAQLESKESPLYKGDVSRGVLDGYKVEANSLQSVV